MLGPTLSAKENCHSLIPDGNWVPRSCLLKLPWAFLMGWDYSNLVIEIKYSNNYNNNKNCNEKEGRQQKESERERQWEREIEPKKDKWSEHNFTCWSILSLFPSSDWRLLSKLLTHQFIYWAWCSTGWNNPLTSSAQLSQLCHLLASCAPPHCQCMGNWKALELRESTT